MKSQAKDALIEVLDKLSSENSELARRIAAMERLLSGHNGPVYQEYLDLINDPKNRAVQSEKKSFDKLRQALLQGRE